MTRQTIATHCDLTVHDGAPALRIRGDQLDAIYPLTPSEAAAIVKRLATVLQQYVAPPVDRTADTKAHPDYQEPAA